MEDALLIIDMLNDFVHPRGALYIPGAEKIIPNVKRELDRAHQSGIPVIYVNDAHQPDDPEFKVWPKHAVEGTWGAQVVDELKPQPNDIIVYKISYSGFYGTNLHNILRELAISRLRVTGVATSICVLYTAVDALMRGYEVEVIPDAVAGLTPEDHKFALRQLTEVLKPRR